MTRNENKKALNYIWDVAGKKKVYILFLLLIQLIIGVVGVVYALFFRDMIDAAVAGEKGRLIVAILCFVGALLLPVLLRVLVRYLEELSKSTYENLFKERVFGEILKRDYAGISAVHSGEWMNLLTSDCVVIAEGLSGILPNLAGLLVKMVGATILIIYLEYRCIYVIIPAAIVVSSLTILFRKRLKGLHKKVQEKDGSVRVFLQERIESLIMVKAFSKEKEAKEYAKEVMAEHQKARMEKNAFYNLCSFGFSCAIIGGYLLGVMYGIVGIYLGTVTYGTMMAIIQLVGQIQNPFSSVAGYFPKYYAMLASAERLLKVEQYEIDRAFIVEQYEVDNALVETDVDNRDFASITMKDICFSYQRYEEGKETDDILPVLKHYNMTIQKGEFIAFTGPSGCGKSTVLKLLMGLYRPSSGEILPQNRALFSYVPQGNMLMSGSIRDVVTFACPEKAGDDVAISKALTIACAKEFVEELEKGLDTVLGERGLGLSEGQMQRISIARALFSDRPVLLLDEATSALDEATEAKLLENLKKETGKTVIIVTHRPAALSVCDRQIAFGKEEQRNG